MKRLTRGELAKQSGVNFATVRYYEKLGLLPEPPRSNAGYRIFSTESVGRIRFIKQAQDIGLSLDEIGELLATEGSASECRQVRDLLRTKLTEFDERLKALRTFRRTLTHYLAECEDALENQGEAAKCPVMVEIAHSDKQKDKKK